MNQQQQIYYWAHMFDDCFNKNRFLFEDREGKNINRAEKWIKANRPELIGKEINGRVMSRARDVVTQIRHDIPSSRLPYEVDSNGQRKKIKLSNGDIIDKGTCKYLPGVCRIYLNDLPNKTSDQAQLVKLIARLSDLVNAIGLYFDKDFSDDDQGRDFNGMTFDELEAKYGKYVEELKRKEREEAKSSLSKFKKNKDYRIVGIDSFEEAQKFSDYVTWCVTQEQHYFDYYTADGESKFYFVIRNDFKTVPKEDPSYATSMLAILINPDGSMDSNSGCTSRLNNGGRFMNPKQVQDLLGVDFYKTFRPISVDETMAKYKSEAIPSKIADKLGGIETGYGVYFVKNGKIQIWKKAYYGQEGKCFAYDRIIWFDVDGNEIDAPLEVGGDFDCFDCASLKSLAGAPQKVGGDFDCSGCTSLKSLEGVPQKVGGSFYCSGCTSLTSLEGSPQKVGRNFYCSGCKSLTSLKGVPIEVSGGFNCVACKSLTSLEGSPQKVGRNFYCFGCKSLTSLEGAPQKVGGGFDCSDCDSLTSLDGAPKEVGGDFNCDGTKISPRQKQSYLSWLKKNPTGNYHDPMVSV